MPALAVLTVRNEGAFLLEWLAHHQAAGFTDFLVFSNDCADGTDAMLDRLAALGHLIHVPNPGPHKNGAQWSALKAADRHEATQAADWIAVLDIDEFVNVHAGDRTLPALIDALPGATAITLTWRLFGNGGVVAYQDRPVTEQFTRAAPRVMGWPWRAAMFKTLFRNDGTYGKLGIHRPRQPDPDRIGQSVWVDGSGRALPDAFRKSRVFNAYGRDNYRLVQLNHYPLGAMESFVLKADRGRAGHWALPMAMDYWVERNLCAEEDRTIAALAPARDTRLATLRADDDLARLHAAAVAWRHARFADLMAEDAPRALFGRLLMTPPSRALTPEETALITAHANRARGGKVT
ncbi:hypothetical protein Ga0609869_002576 [Rhodovulum iodosum]|uniref:Glycosyltransferase family 2 protein n=1 Tax=Rhodovulum iodosum TaxID=68291 RepID=A0ABV3XY65_9RHOB|nr:glycosyltransferase family 2 protein [Rhodovulum robiginosum]RSK33591.1 glycosyltransferase family 2 protein [Rhodovulum robiginosum]